MRSDNGYGRDIDDLTYPQRRRVRKRLNQGKAAFLATGRVTPQERPKKKPKPERRKTKLRTAPPLPKPKQIEESEERKPRFLKRLWRKKGKDFA